MLIARARAAFLPARKSVRRASCTGSALAARRGFVVLVAYVTHELLQQVLQRHEAEGALLLVLHEREMLAAPQHSEEQLAARRRLECRGHGPDGRPSLAAHLEHVERVHHAD